MPCHMSCTLGKKNDIQSGTVTFLEKKQQERRRDLGIIITSDLKWHDQVCSASSRASRMLGILKNTFVSRDANLWKSLYTTYIRPHLEFAVAAWNPYLKNDIETLERVQHRSTKTPSKFNWVRKPMIVHDRVCNNRIVNDWNKLADETINAQMTNGFKSRLLGKMVATSKGTPNTLYG